ncbi:MAG TPA: zf-HC2 domain-containing protein [Gemmatimonadaceae bacterium]|nr:zf-HC2 domain-containing protein [Gemmatimonadaceae bacterium]
MTCAECDEMFLDYFERELEGTDRSRFAEHVAACVRCQGLIRDVDGIRNQAADLQELTPSRDLWSGIEARIQPQVRSIATTRPASISRTWLAAAAAALVIVTSGVTYFATARSVNEQPAPKKAAATVVATPTVAMAPTAAPEIVESAAVRTVTADPVAQRAPVRHAPQATRPVGSTLVSASSVSMQPTPSEMAFAGEIVQLQSVLSQRRAQLDPETVKIVEDNLGVIDIAVKRARAALSKDPASGFLTRQLDNALQKKVELLRTVALLPATT